MDFALWLPQYLQILNDFKFSREEDERSALYLSGLLKERTEELEQVQPKDLERLLNNNKVYIFGEGPTLNEDVESLKVDGTVISADGATSALLNKNIIPDIIVTDLDGRIEDQLESSKNGAIVIIQAHGDNRDKLEKWVPEFTGKIMGTTHSEPFDNIYNFGGFTDGDRAVFLADHFEAGSINIVAFDFFEVGDHTDERAIDLKLRKLTWANLLIGILNNNRIQFRHSDKKVEYLEEDGESL